MRWKGLALGGLLLAGCFDEGGDERQRESAVQVADGLIAFAEIKNNIPNNGGAAGEALLKFIQTPVAAENLITPPGDLTTSVARIAVPPHAALPGCLTTMGSEGCDSFDTNAGMTCEAGPFTFTGHASRTCDVCTDTMGRCTYEWKGLTAETKFHIGYVVPGLDLQIDTTGTTATTLTSITFDTTFDYRYNAGSLQTGSATIKSCGAAMLGAGTPKRLVSSKFVVRSVAIPTHCAVVSFDGSGVISASNPTVGACAATTTGCP
ncbi:MAG: hypothetical protein JNL83_17140 [Myxococcales bacterium]|nr:hypothetical protein [Myxococcales bacterium]